MRVLAGDIGGTKTALAIVEVDVDRAHVVVERRYDSHKYSALGSIVEVFVSELGSDFERASFAIAGPVVAQRCQTTNLPWSIDAAALRAQFDFGPTRLLNDFAAAALGVLRLTADDLAVINQATPQAKAPIAVIGAGTGLGEALLVWRGDRYQVVASEGGHCDFAPTDDVQVGLLRHLMAKHGHVSYERVVSGMGLRGIYDYLAETHVASESVRVRDALADGGDAGAIIGEHALAKTDALCVETMKLFVRAYGAEAGNLALKALPRAGVYLAGGVAPKILPLLTDGTFRAAFVDKGRFKREMENIPVWVVLQKQLGLIGAAVDAFQPDE